MESGNILIEGFEKNPLLLKPKGKDVKILDDLFPYSMGMEIETELLRPQESEKIKEQFLKTGLIEADVNKYDEQRFRFPAGLEGACTLFKCCSLFYKHLYFNIGSGIHYHVDFTDVWDKIKRSNLSKESEWILNELDEWNYRGSYNKRAVGLGASWVRWNTIGTLEFRIGNMEFNYRKLIKQMMHAQRISYRLKIILSNDYHELQNLTEKLVSLKSDNKSEDKDWNEVVNKRIIKL